MGQAMCRAFQVHLSHLILTTTLCPRCILQMTRLGFKLITFGKTSMHLSPDDGATIKPASLLQRMGGRDGGRAITKAICGTITKDYAWMRFAAFDAFEDDQTEA